MNTRIEPFNFLGEKIWLLRDDLLGEFNGNKARKLEYFLHADLSSFKGIISHGSSQSNAIQTLSVFAKMRGLKIYFVVSHLSKFLRDNPCGNFANALQNGMQLIIKSEREKFAKEFAVQNGIKFDIFLPSGTGTSATYLAKHSEFNVFTTPCVGDVAYLQQEIFALDSNSKVQILPPPKKYHFGVLKPELFEIWQQVCASSGVEFELLYDPVGFITLKYYLKEFKNPVLYIHQGGILGNTSQLERYKRKLKKAK